ncbi:MAG: TetR/AcrR family transcriptional regulator [Actinobacteria bacterium]|nr:TetR/AcrR family transcriptional regulator [Actinomycetota bacterium]
MSGIREENKRRTFESIVSAASRCFAERGHAATTIEMIASAAGVSPGTVYNYFGTKNAILGAVVTVDVEETWSAASDAVDLTADDPVDALMPAIAVYVDGITALGPQVLTDVFRSGFHPAHSDLLDDLVSIDDRAILQITHAFERLQGAGLASKHVDPGDAANLLFSVIAVAMLTYMSVPDTTPGDVKAIVRRQFRLVFDGLGAS